ncbi:Centromere protein T [Wickerhamomyces ciferrii]|uniref:Centromere protein T n=1 Tax=Wickerhamomyces ciferrii (strain ATCC 14091 / BCRC 22168 / CBS 111 / JCM 3599 / NBRC 0793 / NRRL Y-1031 F-60-10) TaxID=1206466 RepID=K0KNF2_WICCF|nr:Centromere protein T [Wickerhamomyces ciferrii]CCH46760.1 Centromere protein T [Wickerhamomyces ciferrii]
MSQSTPERRTPRSSRAATPGSRRRSKTPVRTPRRRRSTIVSANLLTPRRQKRVSTTPQKTLQLLSRVLAKEAEEHEKVTGPPPLNPPLPQSITSFQEDGTPENQFQSDQQQDNQSDIAHTPELQLQQESPDPFEFDFHDDKNIEEDLLQSNLDGSIEDVELRRRLSFRNSGQFGHQGLSDIALPVGIMPDDLLDSGPFSDPFAQLSDQEDQPSAKAPDGNPTYHYSPTPEEGDDIQNPTPQIIKKQKLQHISSGSTKIIRRSKEFSVPSNKKLQKFAQTFTKRKLSKEALTTLSQTSDQFFNQISSDLAAYTNHSKNKETLNIKTIYLLLKRQRQVTSIQSLLELADETLPLEDVIEIQRNLHKLQK